jgi:hypothetical protein
MTDDRPFILNQRAILRDSRWHDFRSALREFWPTTGAERQWRRDDVRAKLREFRVRYLIPEMAAFEAAVARTKARQRRAA